MAYYSRLLLLEGAILLYLPVNSKKNQIASKHRLTEEGLFTQRPRQRVVMIESRNFTQDSSEI